MDKQDILDYLDAEVHPLVSPDHYYVYSNLHDMVSELPTVDTARDDEKDRSREDLYYTIMGFLEEHSIAELLMVVADAVERKQ